MSSVEDGRYFPQPTLSLWKPDEEEEKYVTCVCRMALDSLAGNGVADRDAFVANLHGLARCLEQPPKRV